MAWNVLFRGVYGMRNFCNGFSYFFRYDRDVWKRWLDYRRLLQTVSTATGLSLALRYAISPTFQQDATKLQLGAVQTTSHEQQIRQASSMTVDAASQLLSQTVFAFTEISRTYRETMDELMDIIANDSQFLVMDAGGEDEDGNLYNLEAQEVWEQEMDTRSRVNTLRTTLLELGSYMEYVTKVATAAAEASYLAGSEFASTSMCERINSAHRAFEEEKTKNKEYERELLKLQESQAASFSQSEAASPPQSTHRARTRILETVTLIDPLADANDVDSENKSDKFFDIFTCNSTTNLTLVKENYWLLLLAIGFAVTLLYTSHNF